MKQVKMVKASTVCVPDFYNDIPSVWMVRGSVYHITMIAVTFPPPSAPLHAPSFYPKKVWRKKKTFSTPQKDGKYHGGGEQTAGRGEALGKREGNIPAAAWQDKNINAFPPSATSGIFK